MVHRGIDFIEAARANSIKPDTLRRHLHRIETISFIRRNERRFALRFALPTSFIWRRSGPIQRMRWRKQRQFRSSSRLMMKPALGRCTMLLSSQAFVLESSMLRPHRRLKHPSSTQRLPNRCRHPPRSRASRFSGRFGSNLGSIIVIADVRRLQTFARSIRYALRRSAERRFDSPVVGHVDLPLRASRDD